MKKQYNIAILGATGLVGKSMLEILLERKQLPLKNVYAIASASSADTQLSVKGENFLVQDIKKFDFSLVDIVVSALDNDLSSLWLPKLAQRGIICIDNSSAFRYDEDIPLIIAGINSHKISEYKNKNIIANPNCTTIQILLSLHGIHRIFGVKRMIVSTYQAVSGAGSGALRNFRSDYANKCIPRIDEFLEDGSTKEEWKICAETKKILDLIIKVHANCARVPTFFGHGAYINLELASGFDLNEIVRIFKEDGNLIFFENDYPRQEEILEKIDKVFIGRLRRDASVNNGLSYWCLANNITIGASWNTINILEKIIDQN